MKILIELPTWLGDSVMVTPAIENLVNYFSNAQVTILGSVNSTELLANHPKVVKTQAIDKNYLKLFKTTKKLGEFNLFISFRGSWRSKFIKFWVSSKKKYQFDISKFRKGHQVERYNQFINTIIDNESTPAKLILYSQTKFNKSYKKILGINPGASYGSAKRWYPEKFADVACELAEHYNIVIMGGPGEIEISSDIEKKLIKEGITNYQNLCNKTSVSELVSFIDNLDLFITGDSGPMHIAAAFQIPTVAIFGPTNDRETSQWMNKKSVIIKKNLDCQPCMKRTCPLKHHNCMKLIEVCDVLQAVTKLN